MNQTKHEITLLFSFLLIVALIAITRFTNLKPHWGSLEMRANSTITVSGMAKTEQNNQIANFTAGVESIEETKEKALEKTNETMNQLIVKVKELGIQEKDIQTQNASVYQETEYLPMDNSVNNLMYPPPERGDARKGDWRANNSINIKLREVEKADTLLALLNNSGANYVDGPNFSIDNAESAGDELLTQAVINAREKAEKIAAANKQRVGKIVSLTEGGSYAPYYKSVMPMAGAGVSETMIDADLEPGSSNISKTVTVTFELN